MDDPDDGDLGLAGLSPEFQAMLGGMAGHTQRFAEMLEKRTQKSKEAEKKKDDEVYLESYAELGIHEEMLKDAPRVAAYSKAIAFYGNAWAREGGVSVIDVGSGTGLLALLAARAKASRVVAVEASRLAHFLRQVVEANACAGVVEVHECRAEDLELEAGAKVDVVVSEWMGYFLLFENMLPSVLAVRDRYLKPGGLMLPSRCRLLAAPLQDNAWRESKIGFWKDVYGMDMSALLPLATATLCQKPQHRLVLQDSLIAPAIEVLNIDLGRVTEAELGEFEARLSFDIPAGQRVDGFATWFDCEFGEAGWLLSTATSQPPTHWRQTVFSFRQPIEGGGGIPVTGSLKVWRHEEFSRGYRVTFDLAPAGRKRRLEQFELR